MRQKFIFALFAALTVLLAAPSFAQTSTVAYSGVLQIGFGDQDNTLPTMQRSNNAIPICAGRALVNPASLKPAGTTLGTLVVNGRAQAGGSGPGASLTFDAVSGTTGGAQEFDQNTCNVSIPGFANPRLRSRTQVGAAHWPGRKGDFTSMIASAPVPTTPTATYRVAAGEGNADPTATNTMAMTTGGGLTTTYQPPGAFPGPSVSTSVPFFGAGFGSEQLVKGAARFGGGVPYSGGGGVQLGVNFLTTTPGGNTLAPGDYGIVLYANGFLPTDPQPFGTDFKGVGILNGGITPSVPTAYPYGVILGRQDLSYAARTPGGSTQDQQGDVRTAFGGDTMTPNPGSTFMLPGGTTIPIDCVNGTGMSQCPQVISPVAFSGAFFEWTTGNVQHTDMIGDFTTIRTAMGSDVALTPSTGNGQATRRLQLVAPWAASIKVVGSQFGLAALLPQLGFGGVSILDVNIIPVPEPGTLAMLGFGVAGLVGLGATRRRNR